LKQSEFVLKTLYYITHRGNSSDFFSFACERWKISVSK